MSAKDIAELAGVDECKRIAVDDSTYIDKCLGSAKFTTEGPKVASSGSNKECKVGARLVQLVQ